MDAPALNPPGPGDWPDLSIALCTYNGARFLGEQLASLAAQTLRPGEVVIGDDASADDTLAIAAEFARTAPFPVRIVARPERLGHTENFLATARACRGEWIAFADQDDVWFAGKLAEAHRVVTAHPEVMLVNQRALLCDEALLPRGATPFPPDPHPGLHRAPHRRLPLVWPGFLMTVSARLLRDFDPALRPRLANGAQIGHGRWSFLLAAALGSYFVTATPSAAYRRHAQALTGDYRPARSPGGVTRRSLAALRHEHDHAAAVAASLATLAADAIPPDRLRLQSAASGYAAAAQALARRIECYIGESLSERLAAWLGAARRRGYLGPSLYAGGVKAALKDAGGVLRL